MEDRPDIQFIIPWKSRYAILPRPDHHPVTAHNYEQTLLNSFYNILFSLNNMKGIYIDLYWIVIRHITVPRYSYHKKSNTIGQDFEATWLK